MKVSFMKKELSSLQGSMSVPYAPAKRPNSTGRRIFTWAFVLLPVLIFLCSVIVDAWRIRTDATIVQSRQLIVASIDAVVDSVYFEDSTIVFEDSTLFSLRRGHDQISKPTTVTHTQKLEMVTLKNYENRRIALAKAEVRDAHEYLDAVNRLYRNKAATLGELSEARKRLFWAKDHLEEMQVATAQSELERSTVEQASLTGRQVYFDTIATKSTVFVDSLFVKKGSVVFRGEKLCSVRPDPAQWEVEIICKPSHLPYLSAGKKGFLILPDRSKIGIEISDIPPAASVDSTRSGIVSGPRDIVRYRGKLLEPLPEWVMVNGLKVHVQFLKSK